MTPIIRIAQRYFTFNHSPIWALSSLLVSVDSILWHHHPRPLFRGDSMSTMCEILESALQMTGFTSITFHWSEFVALLFSNRKGV